MQYQSPLATRLVRLRMAVVRQHRAIRSVSLAFALWGIVVLGMTMAWQPTVSFVLVWAAGLLAFLVSLFPARYRAFRQLPSSLGAIRWRAGLLALFCVVALLTRRWLGDGWAITFIWGAAWLALVAVVLLTLAAHDGPLMMSLRQSPIPRWLRVLLFLALLFFAWGVPFFAALPFFLIGPLAR